MFIHYLSYLFIFRIALTGKYKSMKAVEDEFYHKVIEAKCSGKFKSKTRYTAEKKRVWRFYVNKNYCIKDIINKMIGEKDKRIVCTKYFFFRFLKQAQCITEVTARS